MADMIFEMTVILALVVVNGLFSGAEIATVTVRKTRIEQMLAEGKKGAKAIAELRARPERFLATVQIGITVVSAAAAAYGGDTLAERLTPVLQPLLGSHAHRVAFALVVVGISYFSLVLGELVPKSLALRAAEQYALIVGRPLLGLARISKPVVWLLTKSSNAVLALFGDRTSFTESRVSPDELKAMLEDASEVGTLHPRVGEIASRAMGLSDLRATDVMVHRNRIAAIEKTATVDQLREFLNEAVHSRIPLMEGNVDHIVGYVSVRDVFARERETSSIASMMRPITFVPESMLAVDVLQTFQNRGVHLAIVVDEHGGTAGLITREDLAEELLGAVASETSRPGEAAIQRQTDGSVLVPGTMAVRDLNRLLDLELVETDDWSTLGGLCVGILGRIPTKGERLSTPKGTTIEIIDASPRRVRSVRILPPPTAEEPQAS